MHKMAADERSVPFRTAVTHPDEGAAVISVSGVVDLSTAPLLARSVNAVLAETPLTSLIIDLTEVPFFASSGMTLLIDASLRVADHAKFAVVADGPRTSRPMILLGLDGTFDIYPDLTAALTALLP